MPDPAATLYDQDFYAWANQQAALLRAGQLSAADIEHIAEEIESMGRSERRELGSFLKGLLLHLLKWKFQPERRGSSWETSILNARDGITDVLADNPSLQRTLPESFAVAYNRARRQAATETTLLISVFPATCPWTFEQIMDAEFWPEGMEH